MTSYNGVAYRGNKTKGGLGFSNTAMNYLIESCNFNVQNVTMKHAISISMGVDLEPFWDFFFLYIYIPTKKNTFRH